MLNKNLLQQKLQSGEPVLGTWSIIPSAVTADIIASSNLDFIIIDREHGPVGYEVAQQMIMACESRNVTPILRVEGIRNEEILRALDIGAHGVQVPNVTTHEEAKTVVEAAKYPPIGTRGFSPFTRAGNYSLSTATTLTQSANENTLVVLNIEGKEAIDNIDKILSLEGIDILFIGLYDLSKALGIPGQVNHPDLLDRLREVTEKINAAGKYTGTIATSSESMNLFLKMGIKYLAYLVDCEMLRSVYTNVHNEFQKACHELCLHH
ncbi:hypothetical protein JYU14_01905 [Simkania negevensis]|uniref:HpcH/HpaI aldolase/citrate lyase domain-containing protein n=1 Tax=Simkania negevensis TaxID=83561 RepID=A0ABS3ARQ4_9BACT|nr:hypothetical protein [Simkania negevensis]